jgi:hypothetical protein
MNGQYFRRLVLVLGALLMVLLASACSPNVIQTSAGQAVAKQGQAYMGCLQAKDLACAHALLSPGALRLEGLARGIADNFVNVELLFKQYAPNISTWEFERVRFSTRHGKLIGTLDGSVEFADGKQGKLKLEFEKDVGTWKVRSSNLEN